MLMVCCVAVDLMLCELHEGQILYSCRSRPYEVAQGPAASEAARACMKAKLVVVIRALFGLELRDFSPHLCRCRSGRSRPVSYGDEGKLGDEEKLVNIAYVPRGAGPACARHAGNVCYPSGVRGNLV